MKVRGLTPEVQMKPRVLSEEREGGTQGVAVECVDIRKTTSGEGGFLECN